MEWNGMEFEREEARRSQGRLMAVCRRDLVGSFLAHLKMHPSAFSTPFTLCHLIPFSLFLLSQMMATGAKVKPEKKSDHRTSTHAVVVIMGRRQHGDPGFGRMLPSKQNTNALWTNRAFYPRNCSTEDRGIKVMAGSRGHLLNIVNIVPENVLISSLADVALGERQAKCQWILKSSSSFQFTWQGQTNSFETWPSLFFRVVLVRSLGLETKKRAFER